MVDFANPGFLVLLPAVPLVVWGWLRRRRTALRYPDTGILTGLPAGRTRLARWGGAGLRAAALALLVVALAGPRWPDRSTRIATQGIAIEMVVDVSGSMAERDFEWQGQPVSRLDAVKQVFRLFVAGGDGPPGERLEGRPDDLIGLVTFSSRPESRCPLTLSHSVLLELLDAEQPRSVPTEAETNIGDALAWGLHRLKSAGPLRKVLLLLTDGEHNVPAPALKPREAAQLAANQHIPVYAIDAGGEAAALTPGPSLPGGEAGRTTADPGAEDKRAARTAAQKTLQAVAQITNGRYFRAHDAAALLAACREIDRLERRDIQSFQYRRYYEGYCWLGLAALVLLVTVQVLELTLWQRIP